MVIVWYICWGKRGTESSGTTLHSTKDDMTQKSMSTEVKGKGLKKSNNNPKTTPKRSSVTDRANKMIGRPMKFRKFKTNMK